MITFPHIVIDVPGYVMRIEPGDEVIVYVESIADKDIQNAYIADYVRDNKLWALGGVFAVLLIVFGGTKGMKSLVSLVITGSAIFWVLLPLLFKGYDPIIVTIGVSFVVSTITLLLIGGMGIKTLSAIVGTTGGVLVAGILAVLVGSAAKLAGFGNEEMQLLMYVPQQVNFDGRGLLFSGMIIGALGAVMDVGISIASAVEEVRRVNRSLKPGALIWAGMNVGRDIMGTMSNTLILAYTGGAVPLLLLFMAYGTPFEAIINSDLIATEVVRALTGSIGLILSIPITSIVAGLLFGRQASSVAKRS